MTFMFFNYNMSRRYHKNATFTRVWGGGGEYVTGISADKGYANSSWCTSITFEVDMYVDNTRQSFVLGSDYTHIPRWR